MDKPIANQDAVKVLGRATTCIRVLLEEGLTLDDLQKPIDDPAMRQRLVRSWQDSGDQAVSRVRREMAELEKLFDDQIERLECSAAIKAMLVKQKKDVLARASGMSFGPENTSFLPVITFDVLSSKAQMAMVRNGDQAGVSYLIDGYIRDLMPAPGPTYYVYDVEDGRATLRKSPLNAAALIKRWKRWRLTAAGTVSLCRHTNTNVLAHHFVNATGSRYKSDVEVPSVYLLGGRLRLSWLCAYSSDDHGGSPSCLR